MVLEGKGGSLSVGYVHVRPIQKLNWSEHTLFVNEVCVVLIQAEVFLFDRDDEILEIPFANPHLNLMDLPVLRSALKRVIHPLERWFTLQEGWFTLKGEFSPFLKGESSFRKGGWKRWFTLRRVNEGSSNTV